MPLQWYHMIIMGYEIAKTWQFVHNLDEADIKENIFWLPKY